MILAAPDPSDGISVEEATTLFLNWTGDVAVTSIGTLIGLLLLLLGWIIGRWIIKRVRRTIASGRVSVDKLVAVDADPAEVALAAKRREQRAQTISLVLNSALAVLVLVTAVVMILGAFGVPVGPLLASAGIVGVALGFGAQSLVKDVLSGTFMLIEDQYGVGDVVDLGPASGTVEDFGLRATRIRSLDGTVWHVPNGEITRVGNMTRIWSRALVEVRFAYDVDAEEARQAMLDAVTEASKDSDEIAEAVLDTPEVAGIESLEYNAIMLRLLVKTTPSMQWTVMRAVRAHMRRLFDERGIRLAVPGESLVVDAAEPKHTKGTGRLRAREPRSEPDQPGDDE